MLSWTLRRLGLVGGLTRRWGAADSGVAGGGAPSASPRKLEDEMVREGSPRVLVLSAGVGSGHNRSAQAVAAAVRQLRPEAHVRYLDVLQLGNALFEYMNADMYFRVVGRAPHLAGYLYDRIDQSGEQATRFGDRMRMAMDRYNLRPLVKLLLGGRWDLAINTHFMPAGIIASLRRAGRLKLPQTTITTDYDVHRIWIMPECDAFFAANEESRLNIMARGIPVHSVHATGIPIAADFGQKMSQGQARRELGLRVDTRVVLQMAGGFGVGPVAEIHRSILAIEKPLQVITLIGRNEALRGHLHAIACPERHHRRVLGYTDHMPILMRAADVVVSKPGGLTVSETLACGASMVIVDPIPGQETRNADFVLEHGAGIKVNNLSCFARKVGDLLADPERLARMRLRASRAARPNAALAAARLSLALLEPERRQFAQLSQRLEATAV